ncbi:kinesin-like protein KIF26A [Hyaena hyaena]|uniref:kinesin-like protein KIF26A n=1 Tax=Hyaena hyaena TaxID=95912 RepID=UPI00192393F2|nr:kinesin-like protein KIF26A [Hyaena hyaena]
MSPPEGLEQSLVRLRLRGCLPGPVVSSGSLAARVAAQRPGAPGAPVLPRGWALLALGWGRPLSSSLEERLGASGRPLDDARSQERPPRSPEPWARALAVGRLSWHSSLFAKLVRQPGEVPSLDTRLTVREAQVSPSPSTQPGALGCGSSHQAPRTPGTASHLRSGKTRTRAPTSHGPGDPTWPGASQAAPTAGEDVAFKRSPGALMGCGPGGGGGVCPSAAPPGRFLTARPGLLVAWAPGERADASLAETGHSDEGGRRQDPCLSALLLDKLPAAGALPGCRPEAERRCAICATHLNQLTREALRPLQAPAGHQDPDAPHGGPGLAPPGAGAATSPRDVPACAGAAGRQPGRAGPDRRRGPAWPPGPSVQVSVAPAGLGGALSTVTIQAQQCLEGMWSVSRVNSFLPPSCLAEAAVAAVAVADTVLDGSPTLSPDGAAKTWGSGGARTAALVTPGPSAAASFFIRAAQKLSLASKRKKPHPPPAPAARGASPYPTDFSGVLQLWPPPTPPCLLRAASKVKDNLSSVGKVKVMLRIWPAQGAPHSAEPTSFLKVDPRKKQVTLYDPATGPPGSSGPRRAAAAAAPKMFAFDAVFSQDSEQAEVCSGTVADVLQAVVGGADGCIFSFGHSSLGKSYTMIGKDSSPQSLGIVPCAISWLFNLIDERREKTGTRFSVRVSATEVCGPDESLRDLLADVASGSLQDARSPGVYLREDVVCGAQLQNQSELRAPTAEKAAFYLDAALAARSSSRPGCSEGARCASHTLFTLHVYQYRMEKCGRGGMSGGRSRLHLIDLGSCEGAPGRSGEASGEPPCLSLSALGSVILALVSGAKHVPYRERRLTMLLRESLATPSCRATMIAHVSDAPARHAETLSTVQLAARIHRLRRKKVKYASSSSGGDSSCEEGRARRTPHLRPFHRRSVAPDAGRLAPGSPGDPEYSSSSEQSCDTVIYVGPGGTALSDRELTDNEGPPDFVPIIPALSRRRPSQGPRDADHFRCSTFAELQERLEGIDGSEAPPGALGVTSGAQPGPPCGARRPSPPEAVAPRRAVGSPMAASSPRGSPGPDTHRGAPEPSKTAADQREGGSLRPALPGPDKVEAGGGGRPLPSPAPPPPRQPEACRAPEDPGGGGADGAVRTPPVGMSGQPSCPRPSAQGRRLERGLLTTTVTLQQPVELNGEDELVLTVVEELSLGGLAASGRPASLASFGSNCSLQALASGSRPVSIISSINDEFDAYTTQAPGGPSEGAGWAGNSGGSSISSRLSEVSVCTNDRHSPAPRPPFRASPDSPAGPDPRGAPVLGSSPDDGSCRFPEHGRSDSPGPARSPRPGEVAAAAPARAGRESPAMSPWGAASAQTIHSSLPRKPKISSAAGRAGCPRLAPSPPGPGGLFEDPWLLRADDCGALQVASDSRAPNPVPVLPCARRVVDGCEVAARAAHRPEAVAPIPPLRRGATTLGVSTPAASCRDAPADAAACLGGPKDTPSRKRSVVSKGGLFPRPSGAAPPAPPVRKSSLEHKSSPALAAPQAGGLARPAAAAFPRGEEEARPGGRADHSVPRATSSLKARAGKAEAAYRPTTHGSLERCELLGHGSGKARDAPGRPTRAVPRLGVPSTSPTLGPTPACRSSSAKGVGAPKPPAGGGKGRSLAAGGSRALGAPVKPLTPAVGRTPGGPVMAPRAAPRAVPGVGAKASRGTIMGTKQAIRAAHSRVNELAASGAPGRGGPPWGPVDSDSGSDSGVNVGEERPPTGPALPSPYSKVTAPRRPQRCSSGHGSDNSSVLSGELPPAMGRTALFYHSGGSSGYESVLRDSEATGSASSAPDSMSDSGAASPGARSRSLRSPKKRATGLQRRRLIPAPMPDTAALGRKPSLPGQWVDLPPPLAGSLKEPFEIKVYEIDDVERLQRHRLPPREDPSEPSQDVEKGLVCNSAKLRLAERRQQRLREVQAKREHLCGELAETQGRLMVEPGRWLEQFEVDPELEPESAEYLVALEHATAALEQCVNLCKAHVMMVTCFDISVSAPATAPGPQEVDV